MPLNENDSLDLLLNVRTSGLPDVKSVITGLKETEEYAGLAQHSVLELTHAFDRLRLGGVAARDALKLIASGGDEFIRFTNSSRKAARDVLDNSSKLLDLMRKPFANAEAEMIERQIQAEFSRVKGAMEQARNSAAAVLPSPIATVSPRQMGKIGDRPIYGGYQLNSSGIETYVRRELLRLIRTAPSSTPNLPSDPNYQMARIFIDELKEFRQDVRRQIGSGGKEYNQFDAQRRRSPMIDPEMQVELTGKRGHGKPGPANRDSEVRQLGENEQRRLADLNIGAMASIRRFVAGMRAGNDALSAVINEWAALHSRYSSLEGVVKANYNTIQGARGILSRRLQLQSGGPIETVSRSQIVANPTTPEQIASNARIESLLAPNTARTTNVDPGFILDERTTTPVLTERFALQSRRKREKELRQIAGQLTGRRWSREAWEQEMLPIAYPGSVVREISPEALSIREAAELQLKGDRKAAWRKFDEDRAKRRMRDKDPEVVAQRKIDQENEIARSFREFNEKNAHLPLAERAALVKTLPNANEGQKAWMSAVLLEEQAKLALQKGGTRPSAIADQIDEEIKRLKKNRTPGTDQRIEPLASRAEYFRAADKREYGRLMRERHDALMRVLNPPNMGDIDDQIEGLQKSGGSPLRIEYLKRKGVRVQNWWNRVAPEENFSTAGEYRASLPFGPMTSRSSDIHDRFVGKDEKRASSAALERSRLARFNELLGGRSYEEIRREIMSTLTGSSQLAKLNELNGKVLKYAQQFRPEKAPEMEERLTADQERLRNMRRQEKIDAFEQERQARRERSNAALSDRRLIAGPELGRSSMADRLAGATIGSGTSESAKRMTADEALKEAFMKIRGISGGSTGGPTSQLGPNPFMNLQLEQYSKLWAARERMLMSEEAALNRLAAKQKSNSAQQASDDQRYADLKIRNADKYATYKEKLDRDVEKHNIDVQRNLGIMGSRAGSDKEKDEIATESFNISADKAALRKERLDKSVEQKNREIAKLSSGKTTKKKQEQIKDLQDEIDLIEKEKKIIDSESLLAERRKNSSIKDRAAAREARDATVADAGVARAKELDARKGTLNLIQQRNDERETAFSRLFRRRRTNRQDSEDAADAATARRVAFGRDRFQGALSNPPGGGGGDGKGKGGSASDYSFIHLIAQLAAFRAVLKYATVDIIQYAARTESLDVVTRQMAVANNIDTQSLLGQVASVKNLNISTQEAHQTVQRMVFAQIDAAKATDLARVAQDAAVISGENSSESLQKIITGITTGQTRLLHFMGLQVSLQQVIREETMRLGRAPTETEKRQAMLNKVLQEGVKIQGNYEASMLTAEKQRGSLTRQWQEAANAIGKNLQPAYMEFIMTLSKGARFVKEHSDAFSGLAAALTGVGAAMGALTIGGLALSAGGSLAGIATANPVLALTATAIGAYTWMKTRTTPEQGVINNRRLLFEQNDADLRDLELQRSRGEISEEDYSTNQRRFVRARGMIDKHLVTQQVELSVQKYRENVLKGKEGDWLDKSVNWVATTAANLALDPIQAAVGTLKDPSKTAKEMALKFIGGLPNLAGVKEKVPDTPGPEQLEQVKRQFKAMGFSDRNAEEGVKEFKKQFEPPKPGAVLSNTELTMFQQSNEAAERLEAAIQKAKPRFLERAQSLIETALPDEVSRIKLRTEREVRDFSKEGELETLEQSLKISPVDKNELEKYLNVTKQIRAQKFNPQQMTALTDYVFDMGSENEELRNKAQAAINRSGLTPEQITSGKKLIEQRDAMIKNNRMLAPHAMYVDLKEQTDEMTAKARVVGKAQEVGEYARRDVEALRRRGDFTQNLFEIQAGPGSKAQMEAMERGYDLRKQLATEAAEIEKKAALEQITLMNKILPEKDRISVENFGQDHSRKLALELLDIENQRILAREKMLAQQREMNRQIRVEQIEARKNLDDLIEAARTPGKDPTVDEAVNKFQKRFEWAKKAYDVNKDEAQLARTNVTNEITLQEDLIRILGRKTEFLTQEKFGMMKTQADRTIELGRLQAYDAPDELKADKQAYDLRLQFAKHYYQELIKAGKDKDEALAESEKLQSEATYDYAKQRIQLYRKQVEDARQMAGSVFDALLTKGGSGMRDFAQGLLKSTGRQVFTNVASGMFRNLQGKIAIPGQGTDEKPTWLAHALSGTILQRNVDPRKEIAGILGGESARFGKRSAGIGSALERNKSLLDQIASLMNEQGSGVIPGAGDLISKFVKGEKTFPEVQSFLRMRRMLNEGDLSGLPLNETPGKKAYEDLLKNPFGALKLGKGLVQHASTTEIESRDTNTAAIDRLTGVIEQAIGGGNPLAGLSPSGSMMQQMLAATDAVDTTGMTTMSSAGKRFFDFPEGSVQQKIVDAVGGRYDPNIALGLGFSESGFDQKATSRTGARGVFQFTKGTAKQYGIDRENLDQNIAGGAKYLGDLLEKHKGNVKAAINEYKGVSVGGATTKDVEKALRHISMYQKRYGKLPSDGVPNVPGEKQANYKPGDVDYWGLPKPKTAPEETSADRTKAQDYKPGDAEYWGMNRGTMPTVANAPTVIAPWETGSREEPARGRNATLDELAGLPQLSGLRGMNSLLGLPYHSSPVGVTSEEPSNLGDKISSAAQKSAEVANLLTKKKEDAEKKDEEEKRRNGGLPGATAVALKSIEAATQPKTAISSQVFYEDGTPAGTDPGKFGQPDAKGEFNEKAWWKGMKKDQAAKDALKKQPKPGYNPDGSKKYDDTYYDKEGVYNGPDADTKQKGGQTASKVVKGAAAAGLGYDAYQQFKKGGARGAIGGTSDILAMASMLPGPQQPYLAAAAAALQVVKMFMGDPRAKYRKKLEEQLKQLKFNEADGQERVMNTRGENVDFDYLGRPRAGALPTSGPMAHFTEQEYKYLTNANAGRSTSVNPRYYYNNDGRIPYSASVAAQVKQLGQAPVRGNPVQLNINVSTMDSRSFMDNSMKIADALRKQLLINHPVSNDIRMIAGA